MAREELLELVVAPFVARGVFGFADAVAVEHDRRSGRERARLRHVLRRAEDADREVRGSEAARCDRR